MCVVLEVKLHEMSCSKYSQPTGKVLQKGSPSQVTHPLLSNHLCWNGEVPSLPLLDFSPASDLPLTLTRPSFGTTQFVNQEEKKIFVFFLFFCHIRELFYIGV